MLLSDAEKTALDALFGDIKPRAEDIGGQAMDSLFEKHPSTKSYFTHMDVTPGSAALKKHGGKIINAINDALNHQENMHDNLAKLREQHTKKLKLNVDTIKLLCNCLLGVIMKEFPNADKSACEKFLDAVAVGLIDA